MGADPLRAHSEAAAEALARYDVVLTKVVCFHAGRPCPVPVKMQMIAWWCPIVPILRRQPRPRFCIIRLRECCATRLGGPSALMAQVRICDTRQCHAPLSEGMVFFEGGGPVFEYHATPRPPRAAHAAAGRRLNDVVWLYEEVYLYLTDSRAA